MKTAALFLLLLLTGCSEKNIIEEDKFVVVYSDLIIAQDTSGAVLNAVDSVRTIVLKKHGISDDKYKSTLNYYNSDPALWTPFFDKVITHLENKKKVLSSEF